MREILFRGKRIDNGEWVEGDFCRCGVAKIDTHKMGQPWRGYTVHEESVGQYTGLKDRNGKRIFEGDIFIDGDNECTGVVEWHNGCFYLYWYGRDGVMMEYGYDEDAGEFGLLETELVSEIYIDALEVAGNIHDNPELLGRCDHGSQAD